MPCRTILLALVAILLPAALRAGEVAPHDARYAIALSSVSGSNNVAGASGEMQLDWIDVCDGWATDLDLRVQLFNPDGEEMRFGTAVTAWEAKDGRRYRYLVRERSTFAPSRDLKGTAVLNRNGTGEARFTQPVETQVALPVGTLFPTAHSLAVLAAAERGDLFLEAPIFDGSEDSEEDLLVSFASIVGPFHDSEPRLPALAGLDYYQVSLAFYAAASADELPTHEVRLRLYENGVVDRQLFDYGDFVLSGDLVELTYHTKPHC